MTVCKIFYRQAKEKLTSLSDAYKAAMQDQSRRLDFDNFKDCSGRVIENYFMLEMKDNLFGYRRRMRAIVKKHSPMFKGVFKNLLEGHILNEQSYDFFVYLADLTEKSFDRTQSRHLWYLIHNVNDDKNLRALLVGEKKSKKLLGILKSHYKSCCETIDKKWEFVPEVKRAYEMAIAMLENAGEPAEEVQPEVKTEEATKELA